MNRTPSCVQAFTLIEMMIAVALGSLLIYTSFAGFRAASQTITVANRLSLENSMMRAGVLRAHDEIDFWMDLDNPTLPDGVRKLKNRNGLPFSPFSATFPGSAASTSTSVTAAPETANGWDPSDTAWAAANPRTWMRGNAAEKHNTDLRFGRYAIIGNLKDQLTSAELASFPDEPQPTPPPPSPIIKPYGDVGVPFHWYFRQVSGLTAALGYYGLFEYLPANSLYVFYGPTNTFENEKDYFYNDLKTNQGGISMWCIKPGGWGFNNDDGGQQTSRGKYRNSYMSSYGILHPSMAATLDLWVEHRRWWGLGYNNDANGHREFNQRTAKVNFLMGDTPQTKPDHWPSVSVSVQRFVKNARHATICRVHMQHPLTGNDIELSFAGFGTSLRGARQQRLPGTGWAKWDNDSDHSTDAAYKHLDSY